MSPQKSPRKCTLCDKKIQSQKELNQHTIDDHNYKSICTKWPCSKQFLSVEARKKHDLIHGTQRFTCASCGKGFIYQSEFSLHSLVHSETKPFTCPYLGCVRKYKMDPVYRRYIKAHSNPPPKVHFENEGCHYDGNQKGLKQHMLGYGPPTIPCGFCAVMFHFCSKKVTYGYRTQQEGLIYKLFIFVHTLGFTFTT